MDTLNLKKLIEDINKFVIERDWEQHHTPRNLATSISIESAELLEHFQWDDLSADDIKKDFEKSDEISEEIADILIYCLRLIYKLDLDFGKLILDKIEKNKIKYPKIC